MAKAVVDLIYEGQENKRVEITYRDGIKSGLAVLNAIDKAVGKQFQADKDWTRWNLVDLVKEED